MILLQIKFTSNELIYYGAIAGAALGLLLGLIVLILGFVKKERSYGVFGFLGSVVLGPISGLLSIIVAAIFTWLILRRAKTKSTADTEATLNSKDLNADASDSNAA